MSNVFGLSCSNFVFIEEAKPKLFELFGLSNRNEGSSFTIINLPGDIKTEKAYDFFQESILIFMKLSVMPREFISDFPAKFLLIESAF